MGYITCSIISKSGYSCNVHRHTTLTFEKKWMDSSSEQHELNQGDEAYYRHRQRRVGSSQHTVGKVVHKPKMEDGGCRSGNHRGSAIVVENT